MNNHMKNIICQDFSQERNKRLIDLKLNSYNQKAIFPYKKVALCCLSFIFIFFLFNIFKIGQLGHYSSDQIYINNSGIEEVLLDSKIFGLPISQNELPNQDLLVDNFVVPDDLKDMQIYKVCDPDDYNKIYEYRISYHENTQNDPRRIEIAFSKEREPLRCYYISNGGKTSKINGIDMNIYGFNDHFYTLFKYKGYNFDIEGNRLTKKEFINFIQSVIKD